MFFGFFFFAISVITASKPDEKASKLQQGLGQKVAMRSGCPQAAPVLPRPPERAPPWWGPAHQGDAISKGTQEKSPEESGSALPSPLWWGGQEQRETIF